MTTIATGKRYRKRSTRNRSRTSNIRHIDKNEIRHREYRGAKNIPDASLDESNDRPCISRDRLFQLD